MDCHLTNTLIITLPHRKENTKEDGFMKNLEYVEEVTLTFVREGTSSTGSTILFKLKIPFKLIYFCFISKDGQKVDLFF
jgi:hypothetical protein